MSSFLRPAQLMRSSYTPKHLEFWGWGVGVEPPLYPPVERMGNACHFVSRGT